jgi:carnitine-CoA ligase
MVAAGAPGLEWLQVLETNQTGEPALGGLRGDPADLRPAAPDPAAAMSVQYTSGTTARPKGVLWNHANALWGAQVNSAHMRLTPGDCQLAYLPLFHTNALAYTMLSTLWTGSRFVLVPKWSTSRFWDIVREHRCSWLPLIGFVTQALLTGEPPPDHSLRMFGSGVCDPGLDKRYGTRTIGWYGMTETISHPVIGDPYLPNEPGSMGRPAPEYSVKVVQEDGTTPAEPGETGELLVKGVPGLSLFTTYLHQPDAFASSFDTGGWFRTGDRVMVHGNGHLSFSDRAKDMLRVGSENVAASEIERVVKTIPGVAEVAVVSRAHATLQQVPVAFVVASGAAVSAAGVTRRCREMLADFKVPREVYVVPALPRSTLNKINKKRLREAVQPEADRAKAVEQWLSEQELDREATGQ